MTTIINREALAAGVPGILTVTQAEIDFYARAETRAWWGTGNSPDTIHGDLLATEEAWLDRKSRISAYYQNSASPVPVFSGGVLIGPTGTSTSPMLTSQGSNLIDPARDFTIWCLSRDGTGSGPVSIGLIGNDGGALSIRHRDSLIQIVGYDSELIGSTQMGNVDSVGTDEWHLIELCYDASAGTLGVYVDGAAVADQENAAWVPLAGMTGDVALMGTYDWVDGRINYSQDLWLAEAGVAQVFAPGSAWREKLHAMISTLHPEKVTLA